MLTSDALHSLAGLDEAGWVCVGGSGEVETPVDLRKKSDGPEASFTTCADTQNGATFA